jgi:acetolactate synthase-1/2/3 large subunit
MKIPTAGLLLKYLQVGAEYIFGVLGVSLPPLFDAISKQDCVGPVLTKLVEGAAFVADGYARLTGKIGMCYATLGPSSTNLVSDVASAYMSNTPLLVTNGQLPISIHVKERFQDSTKEGVNSVAMFEPIARYGTMVMLRYKKPGLGCS